jgi:hypothetical protein
MIVWARQFILDWWRWMIRLIRLIDTGTVVCVSGEKFLDQTNNRRHYKRNKKQEEEKDKQLFGQFDQLSHKN